MAQNSIFKWGLPLALLLSGVAYLLFTSCSSDEPESRDIRAHNHILKGVAHAEPLTRSEHYCTYCHGENLSGGIHGEPSCYTCHGQNWLNDVADESYAPPDHTVAMGETLSFRHHPALKQPTGTCDACHALDPVAGGGIVGNPSCRLCHEQLWQ